MGLFIKRMMYFVSSVLGILALPFLVILSVVGFAVDEADKQQRRKW